MLSRIASRSKTLFQSGWNSALGLGDSFHGAVRKRRAFEELKHDSQFHLDMSQQEVALLLRLGFASENGWVTGVGDEVDQVIPLGKISGQRRGDVEHDEHDTGAEVGLELPGNPANAIVRQRQDYHVIPLQRFFGGHRSDSALRQRSLAAFAYFHVT